MTYGQIGYISYAANTGGKTFDGRDMPTWEDLPQRIRDAWEAATEAAVQRFAIDNDLQRFL